MMDSLHPHPGPPAPTPAPTSSTQQLLIAPPHSHSHPQPQPPTVPGASFAGAPAVRPRPNKVHVPSACVNCKKAHLACDVARPCKRCISVGKDDTCRDVEHKKRGRPKLVDKAVDSGKTVWNAADRDAANTLTRVKGKYTKSANYKASKAGSANSFARSPSSPKQSRLPTMAVSPDAAPVSSPQETDQAQMQRDSVMATSAPSTPSTVLPTPTSSSLPQEKAFTYSFPSNAHRAQRPAPVISASYNGYDRPQARLQDSASSVGDLLVTLFLTMDLVCARVSDESQALWGYHPHDISNQSIFKLVVSEDHAKLREMHHMIKDAFFAAASPTKSTQHLAQYPFLKASSPVFYQSRPGIMSSIAPSSPELTDTVRVQHRDGEAAVFSIRMYIGGGLGSDLSRCMRLENAYVVCVMTPGHPAANQKQHNRVYGRDANATLNGNNNTNNNASKLDILAEQSMQTSAAERASRINAPHRITLPGRPTNGVDASSGSPSPSISSPSTASPSNAAMTLGHHVQPQVQAPGPAQLFSSTPAYSSGSSSSNAGSRSGVHQKPALAHSSTPLALPSLQTGPLHTAKWLYDADPYSDRLSHSTTPSGHHHTDTTRVSHLLTDPFRAVSAPMGGFGVSKYLSRAEPPISAISSRYHQLPLPSAFQSTLSRDRFGPMGHPSQRNISSSAFEASFGSSSNSAPLKRPLAEMADNLDRNRDIDNRHQQQPSSSLHQPHQQQPRSSLDHYSRGSSPHARQSSFQHQRRPSYQQHQAQQQQSSSYYVAPKLDLHTMPPDHPPVDTSAGVCPIVGSLARQKVLVVESDPSKDDHNSRPGQSLHNEQPQPCRWARADSGEWTDCRYNGPEGHSCHVATPEHNTQDSRGRHSQKWQPETSARNDYYGSQRHSDMDGSSAIRHRSSSSSTRHVEVEDDAAKAARAMDAARKRMSVHSLLC